MGDELGELIHFMKKLTKIILNLNEENIESSVELTYELIDAHYPYTFNQIILRLIYSSFVIHFNHAYKYIEYINKMITKFEINKNKINQEAFFKPLLELNTQESYYLLEQMIENKIIEPSFISDVRSLYFAHFQTKEFIKKFDKPYLMKPLFYQEFKFNIEELSKNDWELHKQLIKEGHNPTEIAKIIRNDEIEKLQEISSQNDFDFNQKIEPSLYERCSYINEENVTLIDYAAFFSAIKCFKFLFMNGSNIKNTLKYAIVGGNTEIIHLCEQNHSSFEGVYNTIIKFHKNDIFHYFFNKEKIDFQKID